MFVMPVVSCFRVVCEIAVEKYFPASLEGWPGPLGMHSQEPGDRYQAFCQWMGKATFAGLEA